MREIKFRAWCPSYAGNITDGDCSYDAHMTKPFDLFNIPNDLPDDAIFLEYTGLKDKSGKEIYEGAIVASPPLGSTIPEFRKRILAEIVWIEYGYGYEKEIIGGWMFKDSTGLTKPQVWMHVIGCGETQIIGTIYENPELVKP